MSMATTVVSLQTCRSTIAMTFHPEAIATSAKMPTVSVVVPLEPKNLKTHTINKVTLNASLTPPATFSTKGVRLWTFIVNCSCPVALVSSTVAGRP